jgi:signal transduction histidine kinase
VNPLQKVEQREAVRGLFEHIEPIGIAEEAYGVRRWTVRKTPLGWFAQGPDDQSDGWIGHFVDPQACAERLQDHARRTKALGEGYEVLLESSGSPAHRVFFGSVAERGDGVGFYLMNTGPEGLGSTEYQRAMIARAALLAAALAVALAGGATFFTLRRVRSLGELRSRFIANVSHDLRTPLASILLMAENLESGRVQDEKRVAIYHSKIRSEGARLRRMVDEVLDFSAIEHGERPKTITMDFELEPWVIELRESFDDLARRFGLQLSFVWNDLPANMVGDSSALRRVFDNLVDNALKHGAEPVEVSLGVRQGALCFEVRDHGSGIPAAQRSKVFDAFVRLDEERKGKPPGAGLGLAMARELVQAHGGTLVLGTPSEGSGALFTCLLPMEGAND